MRTESSEQPAGRPVAPASPLLDDIIGELRASAEVKQRMAAQPGIILKIALELIGALRAGRKVLFCGNGGSAADSLHLATEFVGRYRLERTAMPAIALSADVSTLTAIGNDYSYELVFARQVEALGAPGDVLVCITTSGRSANIFRAVETARAHGLRIIGLTGEAGTELAARVDLALLVPSTDTARIQEGYMAAGHAICGLVERAMYGDLRDAQLPQDGGR